ncbi:g3657 [Coccomyxa elongata]
MGAMIELRPSGELSEGELLFGGLECRSESDVSTAVSALSAALNRVDARDISTPEETAANQERTAFQAAGATKKRDRAASLLKMPQLMTIVLPEHSDRMPQLKKPQVSMFSQSKGFVPPHELVAQQDSLGCSLPAHSRYPGMSVPSSTFRPGSVTEGKGRKLAGLEAVRFRNTIMRQTGFIEPDCADFSISYATGS